MTRLFTLLITSFFLQFYGYCQFEHEEGTGSIQGIITDGRDSCNKPIFGAMVFIEGTTYGAFTGQDGTFKMENIAPGMYQVTVSYVLIGNQIIDSVTVTSNEVTTADYGMTINTGSEEEKIILRFKREETREEVCICEPKEIVTVREVIESDESAEGEVEYEEGEIDGDFDCFENLEEDLILGFEEEIDHDYDATIIGYPEELDSLDKIGEAEEDRASITHKYWMTAETCAQPIGGAFKLYTQFKKACSLRVRALGQAYIDDLEPSIIVFDFVINENSTLSQFQIIKGSDPILNQIVLEEFKTLAVFSPRLIDGIPVKSKYRYGLKLVFTSPDIDSSGSFNEQPAEINSPKTDDTLINGQWVTPVKNVVSTTSIRDTVIEVVSSDEMVNKGKCTAVASVSYVETEVIRVSEVKPLVLEVFPNPTCEDFNLRIKGRKSGETRYYLSNITGRMVEEGILVDDSIQISVNDFLSGIYILTVISGEEKISQRLIIE